MVRQLFSSEEVDLILTIPLSLRLPVDRIVWSGTRNGKFSICSAYNSIREMRDNNEREALIDRE